MLGIFRQITQGLAKIKHHGIVAKDFVFFQSRETCRGSQFVRNGVSNIHQFFGNRRARFQFGLVFQAKVTKEVRHQEDYLR